MYHYFFLFTVMILSRVPGRVFGALFFTACQPSSLVSTIWRKNPFYGGSYFLAEFWKRWAYLISYPFFGTVFFFLFVKSQNSTCFCSFTYHDEQHMTFNTFWRKTLFRCELSFWMILHPLRKFLQMTHSQPLKGFLGLLFYMIFLVARRSLVLLFDNDDNYYYPVIRVHNLAHSFFYNFVNYDSIYFWYMRLLSKKNLLEHNYLAY